MSGEEKVLPLKEEVTKEADAARPGPEERLRRLEAWMEQIEQRLKEMIR